MSPIASLFTGEGFESDTLVGFIDKANSKERVIYSEATFFVVAEDKSGTELIVEVTGRDFQFFELSFYVEIGYSPSFEIFFKSGEWMFQEFESQSGVDILAHQVQVGVSIG